MQKNLLPTLLILMAFALKACSTTGDTITVVQEAPRTVVIEEAEEAEEEEFIHLTVGVIDPVTNFDPLYADNLSTKRVLSLIYDGLFMLNREGEPVPNIAAEFEMSEDGREYLITINRDLFFHESPVFTAGLGRRIHARDIKWAFERSARSGHPPAAASLLMNVVGFENYYLEQRFVYDSESRVLDGVIGIEVINAETILFQLHERDDQFLNKLASPLLSIYPAEALRDSRDGLRNRAIGTGHYTLDRIENDGKIILIRDNRDYRPDLDRMPEINRIDFLYYPSEAELFQAFIRDEVQLIPELGPEITLQVITDEGNLISSYAADHNLTRSNASRLTTFHLYANSVVSDSWLRSRLSLLTPEDFRFSSQLRLYNDRFTLDEEVTPMSEYFVSFSDNPYAWFLLTEMHNLVFLPESSLAFFDIRTPTRRTSIYANASDSFHSRFVSLETGYWLLMEAEIVSLYQNYVSGIEPSVVPWALHPADIKVSGR